MAALTSGSWTVRLLHATGSAQNASARTIDMTVGKRHKFVNAIMTYATGESPAGGVPWPAPGSFGMYRNLDSIILHNQYPWSTATMPAATVSGKLVLGQSLASSAKIRFLRFTFMSGTGRAVGQLATTVTLSGGGKFYVTALGWALAGLVLLPTLAVFGGGYAG